jgi:hypothetical protein
VEEARLGAHNETEQERGRNPYFPKASTSPGKLTKTSRDTTLHSICVEHGGH